MASSGMEAIGKAMADAFDRTFFKFMYLQSMEDGFVKSWIIELQEENKQLKGDIRRLNSDLGRTLWNPRG